MNKVKMSIYLITFQYCLEEKTIQVNTDDLREGSDILCARQCSTRTELQDIAWITELDSASGYHLSHTKMKPTSPSNGYHSSRKEGIYKNKIEDSKT